MEDRGASLKGTSCSEGKLKPQWLVARRSAPRCLQAQRLLGKTQHEGWGRKPPLHCCVLGEACKAGIVFLFLLLMRLSWFCCSLRAAIPVVQGAGVRSLSPRLPAVPEFRLHPSCAVWEMFLLEETGFALLEETAFAQLEACKRGHGALQPHFCPGTQRVRAFLLAPVPGAASRAAPWPLPPFQGRKIPLLCSGSCSRPSQQQGLPSFQPLWCIRQ